MKNKEDLIKQVIILSITLVVVIIISIVLNINSKNNENVNEITTNTIEEKTTNTNNTSVDEMINNLKGLIDTSNQNEYEDSGTIKEPIKTGITGEITTENNETIRYEEIWNGDN